MSTFPPLSEWSRGRDPGIMEGWLGWVWVWLQMRRAGLVEASPRRSRAIRSRLSAGIDALDDDAGTEASVVKGTGAYAVVIAAAATIEGSFAPLLRRAIAAWGRTAAAAPKADVYCGVGGVLLAAAEVESYAPGAVPRPLVESAHRRLLAAVRTDLRSSAGRQLLGFAHGVAGQLLALELARAAFGLRTPTSVVDRMLAVLEDSCQEAPDGAAFWPAFKDDAILLTAWCNGSPGIALALMGCERIGLPRYRSRYRELALRALRATSYRIHSVPTFCCGTIGRAQVLLEAYRQFGDRRWRRSAAAIARTVPADACEGRHFRSGALGSMYLQWRLAHPRALPFPAFGGIEARA